MGVAYSAVVPGTREIKGHGCELELASCCHHKVFLSVEQNTQLSYNTPELCFSINFSQGRLQLDCPCSDLSIFMVVLLK